MSMEEIYNAVAEINSLIDFDNYNSSSPLSLSTDSFCVVVQFRDIIIWSSEDDTRILLDEEKEVYEDFVVCFKRRIKEEMTILNKILETLGE